MKAFNKFFPKNPRSRNPKEINEIEKIKLSEKNKFSQPKSIKYFLQNSILNEFYLINDHKNFSKNSNYQKKKETENTVNNYSNSINKYNVIRLKDKVCDFKIENKIIQKKNNQSKNKSFLIISENCYFCNF